MNDHCLDIPLEQKDGVYTQFICAGVSGIAAVPDGMDAREIPAQQYLYYRNEGPVEKIAGFFGKMYDWARQNGHAAGSFKLDIGYTKEGSEQSHDLYIKIADNGIGEI